MSNITDIEQHLQINDILKDDNDYYDILENKKYGNNLKSVKLKPYQTVWLTYE